MLDQGIISTASERDDLVIARTGAGPIRGLGLLVGLTDLDFAGLGGRVEVDFGGGVRQSVEVGGDGPSFLGVLSDLPLGTIRLSVALHDGGASNVAFLAVDGLDVVTPLPLGVALMGTALAGLGLLGARRHRRAATPPR